MPLMADSSEKNTWISALSTRRSASTIRPVRLRTDTQVEKSRNEEEVPRRRLLNAEHHVCGSSHSSLGFSGIPSLTASKPV